jgi:hypothetical protein
VQRLVLATAGRKDGVDLDFKEDQLAIEAHVRMRCGWREIDEISEEEYLEYAYEYMEEHPFESGLVVKRFEAIFYDRIGGEFTVWRKIPGLHFYWQPGYFWYGMRMSLWCNYVRVGHFRMRLRSLAEYFGLIEVANED